MQDQTKQQDMLEQELWALVNRCRQEYQISYASLVGVLELIKFKLQVEVLQNATHRQNENE